MALIRLYFAASIDGFIADARGGVGFLDPFHGEDHGIESFVEDIAVLVMGRETYAFAESYGSWPYEDARRRTIVLTHRPIPNPLTTLETRQVDDVSAFARELRSQTKGDIWILGGGVVMGAFLAAGEVDRIDMFVVPVAIGSGIPAFRADREISQRFTLTEQTRYPSGTARLVYERS